MLIDINESLIIKISLDPILMINPIWLISFIEVANRSSMAAAARHLKVTSAAVSKHILSLEYALGLQLLKRSTRRIDLTSEGQVYFEHAKKIVEAYQNAEAAISHSKEEPTGILKVVCGPQIGNLFVLPNLKEFLSRYPKLRLNMEFTQTMPDLEKENVDVVVGLSVGIPVNCIQRTLMHSRWIFCASPEYLKIHGMPKKITDLAKHQIITRIQRKPNDVIEFKNGKLFQFEPYMFFNDTRELRRSALQGLGIVQLHEYIIENDLKENRLVEILSDHMEQKNTIPIHISYLQTSHVHIKIRKFIDFMVEVMARRNA